MSRVYTWGLNENEKPEIVQFFVESDIKIKSVRACTNDNFVNVFYALTELGKIFTWGENRKTKPKEIVTHLRFASIEVLSNNCVGLTVDGVLYECTIGNELKLVKIPSDITRINQVFCAVASRNMVILTDTKCIFLYQPPTYSNQGDLGYMARRLKRNTVDYLPLSKYPITSAAVANDKAILVLNHGETIIVTGENICGELGVGGVTKDTYNKATVDLEKVHFNDRVDCVALGQTQGLFTTASGDCYTTGRDCKLIRETLLTLTVDGLYCGESMFDSRKPFLLSGLRKVIKYAQSSEARKKYHVLALTEAGDLYAWGSNYLSKVTPSLKAEHTFYPTLVEELYGNKLIDIGVGLNNNIALCAPSNELLNKAFDSELFSDITLESHGRIFHSHKVILLARSPVLLSLLETRLLNRYISAFFQVECEDHSGVHSCIPVESVHLYLLYLYSDELTDVRHIIVEDDPEEFKNARKRIITGTFHLAQIMHALEYELSGLLETNLEKVKEQLVTREQEFTKQLQRKDTQYIDQMIDRLSSHSRLMALCDAHLETGLRLKLNSVFYKNLLSVYNTSDTYSDYSIQTESGQQIHVHKIIMVTASDYFAAMLGSQMEESFDKTYIVEEYKYEALEPLIRYFYDAPGSVDSLDHNNLIEVLICANFFDCKTFKSSIEAKLSRYIEVENIISLVNDVIEVHEANLLREHAIQFIMKHFADIYALEAYKDLSEQFRTGIEQRARKAGVSFTKELPRTEQPSTAYINEDYVPYQPRRKGFFAKLFGL